MWYGAAYREALRMWYWVIMKRSAVAWLALLVSCTAPNPLFVAEDGFGGGGGVDGGLVDLANVDLTTRPSPDMAGVCRPEDRACLATDTISAACVGGQLVIDRRCPADSSCRGGYCTPPPEDTPPAGSPCGIGGPQDSQCWSSSYACQPFVTSPAQRSVGWVCARAVGQGLPGAPCTSGGQCRSGFCGSNGTCFHACQSVFDCPNQNGPGTRLKCSAVQIVVEGVPITAKSCIP